MRLSREFYTRPTLEVSRDLLGKFLVRDTGDGTVFGKIVEVEAYVGPEDKASHAYGGKVTPRNKAEWMEGGHVYIYLVYGMYWQLNISTFQEDTPECVLIRALADPPEGKIAAGPGKLCSFLRLNGSFYGEDLCESERIWLEDRGSNVLARSIKATPRIGIDYAGPFWARRKLRFLLKPYESVLVRPKSIHF